MTGGRLKRLKKYLTDDTFLMTYGDGISNVNIKRLIKFHKKKNKEVTLTVVRPPARFGVVKFKNNLVTYFKEKSKVDEGWINGGFCSEIKFLTKIKNDRTFWKRNLWKKHVKVKILWHTNIKVFGSVLIQKRLRKIKKNIKIESLKKK